MSGEIRKSGRVLTKEEREGTLKECGGFAVERRDETCVIRIQRDLKDFSYWKYALNYGTRVYVCDGVQVLTWNSRTPNDHVNSNTELHGANCIQDACDLFVLPSYSVCPCIVKVSKRVQISEESIRPLSQNNLDNRYDEREVHHREEPGFPAPTMPGSTTKVRTPSPVVPHVHLSVTTINLLERGRWIRTMHTSDV